MITYLESILYIVVFYILWGLASLIFLGSFAFPEYIEFTVAFLVMVHHQQLVILRSLNK